ncbi:LysM domain-containing protein [Cryptosporangium sp. NPDC051539]|uniref:LysM domain-containing protein n=1 Tax=Cryptosporangium sp. NPDC051539 TaxID=3363962 RepID=UPI0037909CCF
MTDGRYAQCEQASATIPDEAGGTREVRYLRRRLLPPLGATPVVAQHTVGSGDRPDLVTARYLGDPEQYWRVCDANLVIHPDELTAPDRLGTRVSIPLPTGAA